MHNSMNVHLMRVKKRAEDKLEQALADLRYAENSLLFYRVLALISTVAAVATAVYYHAPTTCS